MEYIMKIYNSQYFLIGIFILIIILAIVFLILLLSGGKKKSKKEKVQERKMQESQINNNINSDLQTAVNDQIPNQEASITDVPSIDNIVITPDMQQTPEINNAIPENNTQDVNNQVQTNMTNNIFENTPENIPTTPVMDVPSVNPLDSVPQSNVVSNPVESAVSPVIPDVNPINNVVEPVSINILDSTPVSNSASDVNPVPQSTPKIEQPEVKLPSIDDLLNQANAATNNTATKQPDQFSSVYVNNNQNNGVELPKLNDDNK